MWFPIPQNFTLSTSMITNLQGGFILDMGVHFIAGLRMVSFCITLRILLNSKIICWNAFCLLVRTKKKTNLLAVSLGSENLLAISLYSIKMFQKLCNDINFF